MGIQSDPNLLACSINHRLPCLLSRKAWKAKLNPAIDLLGNDFTVFRRIYTVLYEDNYRNPVGTIG